MIKTEERKILEQLNNAGFEAYFVGGCVRDSIRGYEYKDIDIATSATPEEVKEIFPHTIDTGIKHGTVTVMPLRIEVTTFRTDGKYTDNRRPENVTFVKSLREDLKRRDFTINAIAMDKDGKVFDPFGGRHDLLHETIVAVGDPDERFKEDALRILRAMRFASTFGFTIEPKTAKAMHKNKELLKNISAERIFSEFKRILDGKHAHIILREYVDILGVVIPELLPMVGFDQNNPYHKYDVFEHTIKAVENLKTTNENRIYMRMAMFFHDIGKPSSYTEEDGRGHFYGHPKVSAKITEGILNRLRADKKTTRRVVELVRNHDVILWPKEGLLRKRLNQHGSEILSELIEMRKADTSAQSELAVPTKEEFIEIEKIVGELLKEEACFKMKDLAVNGRDLLTLGIKEGPQIGKILKTLLAQVMDGEIKNEKEILLSSVKEKFLT